MQQILLFAEGDADGPSGLTLELATKARTLGRFGDRVRPGARRGHGCRAGSARRIHCVRTRRTRRTGWSACMPLLRWPATSTPPLPDAVFFGQTADGRDTAARLAVLLRSSGGPPTTSALEVVRRGDPRHRGADLRRDAEHLHRLPCAGARIGDVSPEELRGCSRAAAMPRLESRCVGAVDPGETQAEPLMTGRHAEVRSGPQLDDAAVVVSGGRGLGQPEAYSMVDELAGLARCSVWGLARHRGRWLGSVRQAGWADRQGREADRLHRLRYLGCHAAPGWHEGLQEHRCDKQGS